MSLFFKSAKEKIATLQARLEAVEAEEKKHIPSLTSREIFERYKAQKKVIAENMRKIAYERIVELDRKMKRLGLRLQDLELQKKAASPASGKYRRLSRKIAGLQEKMYALTHERQELRQHHLFKALAEGKRAGLVSSAVREKQGMFRRR